MNETPVPEDLLLDALELVLGWPFDPLLEELDPRREEPEVAA